MAEDSKIEWTDHTFNPWRGCTKISEGCAHCYAERQSHRNLKVLGEWGPKGTRVLAADAQWREPEKWNLAARRPGASAIGAYFGRQRVFCASLADVFEDWDGQMQDSQGRPITDHFAARIEDSTRPYTLDHARARLWDLIRATPNLDWLLLTKRPENIIHMMPAGEWPNVWLGVSVESQDYAPRIDMLNDARQVIRCPVGFVSAEPLLGPLHLWDVLPTVQWLIIGGESGAVGEARSMHLDWVRSLLAQCQDTGCAPFVKQMGRTPTYYAHPNRVVLGMVNDPLKGGNMEDWPLDIRVRRFPR